MTSKAVYGLEHAKRRLWHGRWRGFRCKLAAQCGGGGPVSTAFIENAGNEIVAKRLNKKQQMPWSRTSVRPFLDVRAAVLNDMLERRPPQALPRLPPCQQRRDNRSGCVMSLMGLYLPKVSWVLCNLIRLSVWPRAQPQPWLNALCAEQYFFAEQNCENQLSRPAIRLCIVRCSIRCRWHSADLCSARLMP